MPSDPSTKDLIAAAREQARPGSAVQNPEWINKSAYFLHALADRLEEVEKWREAYGGQVRWLEAKVAELRKLTDTDNGYWYWEEDGENDLDSLVCAIVITPDALRALLREAEKEERDTPEAHLVAEILAELRRAREKFPGDNVTTLALVEEVGELAKATFEETRQKVREEAVQVATMAMRVILDGDATLDDWRASKGLEPLCSPEPYDPEPDDSTHISVGGLAVDAGLYEDPEPEDDPWERIEGWKDRDAPGAYVIIRRALLDLRDRVNSIAVDATKRVYSIEDRLTTLETEMRHRVTKIESKIDTIHTIHTIALNAAVEVRDRLTTLEGHADRGSEAEAELRSQIERIAKRVVIAEAKLRQLLGR